MTGPVPAGISSWTTYRPVPRSVQEPVARQPSAAPDVREVCLVVRVAGRGDAADGQRAADAHRERGGREQRSAADG